MSETIHLNVKSAYSYNSIVELVDEAYSEQISIFQYEIGRHMPIWRRAKTGDKVIYSIDDIALCGGELTFIKSKAFRPRWIDDHDQYKMFVDFTRSMCCQTFSKKWAESMHKQHVSAIESKKWLFAVSAVIKPIYYYAGNKHIIDQKVKEVIACEDEELRFNSPFYMGEMIDE